MGTVTLEPREAVGRPGRREGVRLDARGRRLDRGGARQALGEQPLASVEPEPRDRDTGRATAR